jgi:hypothetical protein
MRIWSIKNAYNEAENEHKDLLRQQRLGFVAKHFKEFDMANAKKKRNHKVGLESFMAYC